MTRAQVLDLLCRRQAAMNAHDVDALTALHTDDSVVDSLIAGTITGRAAIADVYRAWFQAFPDATLTTDDVIVEGDRVVELATVSGTDMGMFMGLPATHKPFRMPIVFVYTFADGAIARERRLYDFTGLLLQIGALKAKPV